MKMNIKTKVAIILLLFLFPFVAVYVFAAATFQPNFEQYVRESFEGGWGILTAIYFFFLISATPALCMWLVEEE